ncbi:TPA: PAS domain-containing protein [Proteus mirabilis]|nr:PAS domain-containing protein [Proteus mirabilis]HEJ9643879.1 PAS domain-containing protein [Proteus mirabilis]HEK0780588.1 PAS domain-containing protein [Proteus mirabilis]HEK1046600.1 PAS domain-containing protein [Proteus mirabilis]
MDLPTNQKITEEDRHLLRSYIPFLDNLGQFLGDYCEIVLHSFEDLRHSVIHIVNGHVTGRGLGAPVTNIALEKLSKFNRTDQMWEVYFNTKSVRPFKSSSTLIVNNAGTPIGMICMNFALDMPLNALINSFTDTNNLKHENFSQDVNNLVQNHLEPIKKRVYGNKNIPSKYKNLEIIKELNESGLFEFSATHKIVSAELGISLATIYKHLRNLSKK